VRKKKCYKASIKQKRKISLFVLSS